MTQHTPDGIEVFRELTEGLIEVLQSWPIYRRFEYGDHDRHFLDSEGATFGVLPEEITLPCRTCTSEQRWRRTEGGVGVEGWVYLNKEPHVTVYKCINCEQRTVYFTFYWYLTEAGGLFQKIGQYPPLHYFLGVPREMSDLLSDAELKLYRQALSNRNSNFGIGAVHYLRRVVGNTLEGLLERGLEAARNRNRSAEALRQWEEVINLHSPKAKIERVLKIVSPPLEPGAYDPLGPLCDLFGDALDLKSDEESIDVFDKSKSAFEYLLRSLSLAGDEAEKH